VPPVGEWVRPPSVGRTLIRNQGFCFIILFYTNLLITWNFASDVRNKKFKRQIKLKGFMGLSWQFTDSGTAKHF
jgi:hypothetical protein